LACQEGPKLWNMSSKEQASSTEYWELLWKIPSYLLPIAQLWWKTNNKDHPSWGTQELKPKQR